MKMNRNNNENLIDIREFCNGNFQIDIFGVKRKAPLIQVKAEKWIVVNDFLCFGCDVEFTKKAGKELSERIGSFSPEVILTPGTKAISLAYEISRILNLPKYVLARKTHKDTEGEVIKTRITSITTPEPCELYIEKEDAKYLRGKRVVLVDDVVSTGKTMQGLKTLATESGAKICAIAVVWIEGPGAFETFIDEFREERFVFIDVFPLYSTGTTYEELLKEKERVESKIKCQNIRVPKLS